MNKLKDLGYLCRVFHNTLKDFLIFSISENQRGFIIILNIDYYTYNYLCNYLMNVSVL